MAGRPKFAKGEKDTMGQKEAFLKLLGLVRELAQVRHAGEAGAIAAKLDELEVKVMLADLQDATTQALKELAEKSLAGADPADEPSDK